jgi:hypothetical protein
MKDAGSSTAHERKWQHRTFRSSHEVVNFLNRHKIDGNDFIVLVRMKGEALSAAYRSHKELY